jgi:hypothetical protein
MKRSSLAAMTMGLLGVLGTASARADTWPTYAEIGTRLANLEATYPTLCKRYDLGLSVQGRHLWAIRISDNVLVEEDEPEVKYISTMHGDEIVGVMLCLNLADWLMANYGVDPQATNIVNNVELWLVPLMNPDGYDRSPRTRENYNGVNLNRDFPEWTSGNPNTTAGRAAETAAIMNWSFAHSFTCSVNFHGGAMVVNYPYDYDTGVPDGSYAISPDDDLFIWMSEQYSQHNTPMWNSTEFTHGITNGSDWYNLQGGMQDWNYRYMGNNEVCIELNDTKEPSASQIPTLWNDNRASMLAYTETSLTGVRGLVTDGATGAPLSATVTVVGRNHPIYTDPDVGDYHRMLRPGTYTLTFAAAGYDTTTISGVVVNSGNATVLNVPMFGPVSVVSPNGGESLTSGSPTTVTWTGNPASQFQVQYTDNYGVPGAVSDSFESGTLDSAYTQGGNLPWFVTNSSYHQGTHSARAGAITHSQSSWMSRIAYEGSVTFWYRVSSEANDYFNFYVDDVRKLHRSGTAGTWTLYSTAIAAGSHVVKWEYVKNASTSSGTDTVWIDQVALTGDATAWTDIIALTPGGTTSTPWTPGTPGTNYKVRVRPYSGGVYGNWDESNAVFAVVLPPVDGDYDTDGDVDLVDAGWFQVCFGAAPTNECKAAFDFDASGAIDLADWADFVPLLDASGPPI